MARSLDQILQELDAGGYSQSRQLINDRLAQLPAQADAQIAGLNAVKDNAFNQITAGAQDRGVGFSGIPLADQARYVSTDFLPAVAKVQQTQNDTKTSLLDALNQNNMDKMKFGQSLYTNDLNLDEQKRQFDAQQAAAARAAAGASGAFNGLFDGGAAGTAPAPVAAGNNTDVLKTATIRPDGGFNFVDSAGRPVNAFQYAQGHNLPLRTLLSQMASKGDKGAVAALNFVGNDGNADPTKITSKPLADLYYALTGRKVAVFTPPSSKTAQMFRPSVLPGVPGVTSFMR